MVVVKRLTPLGPSTSPMASKRLNQAVVARGRGAMSATKAGSDPRVSLVGLVRTCLKLRPVFAVPEARARRLETVGLMPRTNQRGVSVGLVHVGPTLLGRHVSQSRAAVRPHEHLLEQHHDDQTHGAPSRPGLRALTAVPPPRSAASAASPSQGGPSLGAPGIRGSRGGVIEAAALDHLVPEQVLLSVHNP